MPSEPSWASGWTTRKPGTGSRATSRRFPCGVTRASGTSASSQTSTPSGLRSGALIDCGWIETHVDTRLPGAKVGRNRFRCTGMWIRWIPTCSGIRASWRSRTPLPVPEASAVRLRSCATGIVGRLHGRTLVTGWNTDPSEWRNTRSSRSHSASVTYWSSTAICLTEQSETTPLPHGWHLSFRCSPKVRPRRRKPTSLTIWEESHLRGGGGNPDTTELNQGPQRRSPNMESD